MSRPRLTILSRARAAGLAAVAALALAACNQTDDVARRANKPLPPEMLSLMSNKGMAADSPILVRIFKKEAELEVWKVNSEGQYALLKTYPICRWSGELGPKVKMGDRQAPEGFYNITPGQMNPNSNYYLSFNLGFPNAFDRSYGRTGEFLMVHGDCSSAGCYAMTDEQISEIFSLARESFAGGQRSFQVQAYPFRMTPKNLARYRNNPNMAFWKNLKEGNDHFEVTRQEPKVAVCGRRYVFDATPTPGGRFDSDASCPSYEVPPEIESRVAAKDRRDAAQVAALAPNSPVAPVRTGSDGGMHPVFLAQWKAQHEGRTNLAFAPAPGTMPDTTRPPVGAEADAADSDAPAPQPEPAATSVAYAAPAPEAPAGAAPAPAPKPTEAGDVPRTYELRVAPQPQMASTAGTPAPKPAPKAAPKPVANAKPATTAKPAAAPAPKPQAAEAKEHKPGSSSTLVSSAFAEPPSMTGSSPVLPTSGFSQ